MPNPGFKAKLNNIYNDKILQLLSELPDFCTDYNVYIREKNSIKTRLEYLQDIRTFFRYLTLKNPMIVSPGTVTVNCLESLNGFDFDDYLAWLSQYKFDPNDPNEKIKTNSKPSKKKKMMAIRSLYHFLYSRDYISHNPSEKAIIPSVSKKRSTITILEDNQCNEFLKEIDIQLNNAYKNNQKGIKYSLIYRDKVIVYLILGTGLRVSEVCAINCTDISFELGYINVIRKGDGDDDKTSDQIYLSDEVATLLSHYIKIEREKIGSNEADEDALFISSKHQRITPRAIELMVKNYANAALGTKNNIHPHTLRATFGTRYYKMTHDISATSTAMNHSGIEITAKYYVQEDKKAKEKVKNLHIKT